jgi:AraC family transcriptional regulator
MESTAQSYQERILRVLVYIQTHLDDPLPLDEMASVACFSPYHFHLHRIFRGMVGEPVKEHVRRLRLERAAGRLKFSTHPVTEVAFDAGYESHEAFTRTTVAFIRHVGPYAEVGQAWQRLFGWLMPHGLFRPGAATIGICLDCPEITDPEKLRYDATVTVPDHAKGEGEVGIQTIEAGEYAVALHQGSYDRLADFYTRICGEWLPWSGRELASAPSLEHYLNNPQMTPPEQLLTRVFLPLVS